MQPTPSSQSAKVTERIKGKAFEYLEQHPEGLPYTEPKARTQAADSNFKSNTINGCIRNLDTAFPAKVYKPSKGLYRLLKHKPLESKILEPPGYERDRR